MEGQTTQVVKKTSLPVMIYPSHSRIIQRNEAISNSNLVTRTVHVQKSDIKRDSLILRPNIAHLSVLQLKKEKYKALPVRNTTGKENEGFKIYNSKNAKIITQNKSKIANVTRMENIIFHNSNSIDCYSHDASESVDIVNDNKDITGQMLVEGNTYDYLKFQSKEVDLNRNIVVSKIKEKLNIHLNAGYDVDSALTTKLEELESLKSKRDSESICRILEEERDVINLTDDFKSGTISLTPPEYPPYFDGYGTEDHFPFNTSTIKYDPCKVIIGHDISFRASLARNDLKAFYYSNKIEAVLGEKNITLPADFSAVLLSLQGNSFQPEPNEKIDNMYECDISSLIADPNLLTLEEKRAYLMVYNSCKSSGF